MSVDNILEIKDVSKAFRHNIVLNKVSFNVRRGSVHALMGENGAGKSTLMKILMGIHKKDEGTITLNGSQVDFQNPAEAMAAGIAMIHQELSFVGELPIYENVFLGREYKKNAVSEDFVKMRTETEQILQRIGLEVSATTPMKNLTVAQAQMVEIAKAMSKNANLIIMDEPTSALTDNEVKVLFNLIKQYVGEGNSIIYITHKLEEVDEIADEVTILRDGFCEGTYKSNELNSHELVKLMVNREIEDIYPKRRNVPGEVVLEAKGLCVDGVIQNINFDLRKGEILGFAGLLGSGRTETAETLFGLRAVQSGKILIKGDEVTINAPKDAIDNKIGMVTEDRKGTGLVLPMSIEDNILLVKLKKLCQAGVIRNRKEETEQALNQANQLKLKMTSLLQPVMDLSGGNQQKVVLSKWLLDSPEILILDEPTRGIDVGAKEEIYKLIVELAEAGKSIILISSELSEVIGLADRVAVFKDRTIKCILEKEEVSQEKIMNVAMALE